MGSVTQVRFIDYPSQFRKIEAELMETIHDVLSRGQVMLRRELEDFEAQFAEYVGTKAAVGTNSCTDALFLALHALGLKAGDEVITVSHTFVATVTAIVHNGATPVFVDVGPDHAMNPAKIEEAITPQTKAIMPVHLNGYVCEMDKILEIATRHKLLIIEDSAQAVGAKFQNQCGGSWGNAGCFSFYPAKQLGAYGDGGAVTTNDLELAEHLKLLRNHGRRPDGSLIGFSFNSRMDNLQAAILSLKLKHLPAWTERRREIAQRYNEALSDLPQLKLPTAPQEEGPRYIGFQNYEFEAQDRDGLLAHLRKNNIEIILPWGGTAVHQFKGLDLEHFSEKLPLTETLFKGIMTLPMHEELTDEHVEYVIEHVRQFYGA